MSDLFRKEAMEAAGESKFGGIRLVTPVGRTIYTGAIVALFAVVVIYLCLGSYTRRVTVTGQLTSSVGLVHIHIDKSLVVSHILVEQGQRVRKGQVLIEYASESTSGTTADVNADIAKELQTQKAIEADELSNSDATYAVKAKALKEKIAGIENQKGGVNAKLLLLTKHNTMLQGQLQKYEELGSKKYISQIELDQHRKELISGKMQISDMEMQLSQMAADIDAARNELAGLPFELVSHKNQIRTSVSQINQSLIESEARRTSATLATVDGIVTSLPIKTGLVVKSGELMASILPDNGSMEAILMVDGLSAGFVRPNQQVFMRLDAFPYQKFGHVQGRIATVDHNPTSSTDIQNLFDVATNQPYYLATVKLGADSIADGSQHYPLLPGMTFQADVMLDRRRLIEWVISPVLGFSKKRFD